jgi:hypothetical protein
MVESLVARLAELMAALKDQQKAQHLVVEKENYLAVK